MEGTQPCLPWHVLESIFKRLPPADPARTKALSSYWNSFAQSALSGRFLQAPWLMRPSKRELTFFNMENNMACGLQPLPRTTSDVCIGSSHGWLIFMDLASFSPSLLNPFTKARIHLPSLKPVFGIHRIQKSINQAGVSHVAMFYPSLNSFRETCISTENLLVYIPKAILTAEPVGNYGVVVLCRSGETKKFAYYRNGDNSWTEVINRARKGILLNTYEDIISHENKLYALDYWSFSIDTWDLRLCQASETLTTAFPDEMMQDKLVRDLFPKKFYLAESGGEILLVAKFRDFHHKTKVFQVFKLDLVGKKWVRVNSLGDRSLFLGGNHSISIPNKNLMSCKGKSLIYFSDDLWEYEEYSGHDNGIYSLEDGRFLRVYEADTVRTSPFWIVPTLCKLNS